MLLRLVLLFVRRRAVRLSVWIRAVGSRMHLSRALRLYRLLLARALLHHGLLLCRFHLRGALVVDHLLAHPLQRGLLLGPELRRPLRLEGLLPAHLLLFGI